MSAKKSKKTKKLFVYLATNEFMPNLVKIGSADDVQDRMRTLSSPSSTPGQFVCRYWHKATNAENVERQLHQLFQYCRVDEQREFFETDWFSVAIVLVMLIKADHDGRVETLESILLDQEQSKDSEETAEQVIIDESATDQRERYMAYVKKNVKTRSTVNFYDRSLSVLSEKYLGDENVYGITDVHEAQDILKRLSKGGDIFSQYERNVGSGYNGMRAAMGKYVEFLLSLMSSSPSTSGRKHVKLSHDATGRRVAYMEYIRDNVRSKKPLRRAKSCDMYLQHLAENVLKISTVYDITSIKEADKIYHRLLSKGNLSRDNQKYCAGGMSAAMGHYVDFLRKNK